jgi:hypothetical protein
MRGFRPLVTPVLLMVFIPFFFGITSVTSMGSALLPLMWGWAIAAGAVVREGTAQRGVRVSSPLLASRE